MVCDNSCDRAVSAMTSSEINPRRTENQGPGSTGKPNDEQYNPL